MRNKRKIIYYVIATIGVIAIVIYTLLYKEDVELFAKALVGFLGIAVACFELSDNASTSKGEFILNLQQSYLDNPEFTKLYLKCWDDYNSPTKERNVNFEKDRKNIVNYLTFFESIYIMIREGNIKIKLIDDLFARRFFMVVNNKTVQDNELIGKDNYKYYLNVFKLYLEWEQHRQAKKCKAYDEKVCGEEGNYRELKCAIKKNEELAKLLGVK